MGALHVNGQKATGVNITLSEGVFMDANNTIKALTEFKPSMSYEATEDCFVMIYIVFGSNSMIKIDNKPVANYDGNGNFGISNTFYVKAGQTISVSGASASYNSYYIVYGIQQGTIEGKLQPVIYSTEEREVGVWIDGKPLYQKTVIKDSNFVSGANQIVHNISNIEKVINDESTLYYNNGDCVPLPVTNQTSQGWSAKTRDFGDTYFYLDIGNDMLSYVTSASFTLLYTKTTDQPGAGTWTPDGAYAHHYSTDEKVVGTWIDGSTIYEITTDMGSAGVSINAGASKDSNIPIGNIEKITYSQAISQSGKYFPVIGAELGGSYVQMINMGSSNRNVRWFTIQYTKSSQ